MIQPVCISRVICINVVLFGLTVFSQHCTILLNVIEFTKVRVTPFKNFLNTSLTLFSGEGRDFSGQPDFVYDWIFVRQLTQQQTPTLSDGATFFFSLKAGEDTLIWQTT